MAPQRYGGKKGLPLRNTRPAPYQPISPVPRGRSKTETAQNWLDYLESESYDFKANLPNIRGFPDVQNALEKLRALADDFQRQVKTTLKEYATEIISAEADKQMPQANEAMITTIVAVLKALEKGNTSTAVPNTKPLSSDDEEPRSPDLL